MSGEFLKGCIHFGAGGLMFALGLHNLVRFAEDRKPRNLLNAGFYVIAFGVEAANTKQHWSRP